MVIPVTEKNLDALQIRCIEGREVAPTGQEARVNLESLALPKTIVNLYFYGRLDRLLTKLNFEGTTRNSRAHA